MADSAVSSAVVGLMDTWSGISSGLQGGFSVPRQPASWRWQVVTGADLAAALAAVRGGVAGQHQVQAAVGGVSVGAAVSQFTEGSAICGRRRWISRCRVGDRVVRRYDGAGRGPQVQVAALVSGLWVGAVGCGGRFESGPRWQVDGRFGGQCCPVVGLMDTLVRILPGLRGGFSVLLGSQPVGVAVVTRGCGRWQRVKGNVTRPTPRCRRWEEVGEVEAATVTQFLGINRCGRRWMPRSQGLVTGCSSIRRCRTLQVQGVVRVVGWGPLLGGGGVARSGETRWRADGRSGGRPCGGS